MSDCLFCKIAAGDIPSSRVAESDTLVAFNDIAPQAPVHILIIPKKHIESNLGLTEDDSGLIADIHMMANSLARERGLDKSGFRLVTNVGAEAGQTVFHLHYHLLGGRSMSWPPG